MCISGLVPAPCDFPIPIPGLIQCTLPNFICDGNPLCPNGEDEANCAGGEDTV